MKKWLVVAVALVSFAAYGCSTDASDDGGNSGTPSNPSNPSEPTNPTNPTDPTNTTNPTDPTNPTEPTEPTEPKDCTGIDLQTSSENCGVCGHDCGINSVCAAGVCGCAEGYFDCDNNGTCETAGECVCHKGDKMPCYTGEAGTENVGICHGGHYECIIEDDVPAMWGLDCIGEVTPEYNITCVAGQPNRDGDCNGVADSRQDEDEDGFAICGTNGEPLDCCDSKKTCNTEYPELINPGKSLDCNGNHLDDDCDGEIDEDEISCNGSGGGEVVVGKCEFKNANCGDNLTDLSGNKWSRKVDNQKDAALDLIKAMDICMETGSSSSDGGILEWNLSKSGKSTSSVNASQVSVMNDMASKTKKLITPRVGKTFALLSSGQAIDVAHGLNTNDLLLDNSGYRNYCEYNNSVPQVYLEKHNRKLESNRKCGAADPLICDSVQLHLKLKAPGNAKGFSFDFRFFSREYPYYVCSQYNDFFMVLLTDEKGKPFADTNNDGSIADEDANISFDKLGNAVSVNNAFFTTCAAPKCGDSEAMGSLQVNGGIWGGGKIDPNSCPASYINGCVNSKCGTCEDGYDDLYAYYSAPYTGTGSGKQNRGGGTAWLTTKAPVTPGQVFNLDFYIWDTYDSKYDSSVILDNFKWLCDETVVSTDFAPPVENIN